MEEHFLLKLVHILSSTLGITRWGCFCSLVPTSGQTETRIGKSVLTFWTIHFWDFLHPSSENDVLCSFHRMKPYQQHVFVYKSLFRYVNKHCCWIYILGLVVASCRLRSVVEKTWVHTPKIAGSIPIRETFFQNYRTNWPIKFFSPIRVGSPTFPYIWTSPMDFPYLIW